MQRRVVLVDRHPVPRAAIAGLFQEAAPDALIDQFGRAEQALPRLPGADLMVCESSSGAELGPQWIRQLVVLLRPGKLVVLGASKERTVCAQAHQSGAWGHIPMTSSAEVITAAFRLILAGGTYFPALHPMRLTENGLSATATVPLTPRQRDVLALIEQGLSNREIAERMGVALPTVKLHAQGIFRRLGAKNRTEAARLAREQDL